MQQQTRAEALHANHWHQRAQHRASSVMGPLPAPAKETFTFLQPKFDIFFSGINCFFGLCADVVDVRAQLGPFAEVDSYIHAEMLQAPHLLCLPHRPGVLLQWMRSEQPESWLQETIPCSVAEFDANLGKSANGCSPVSAPASHLGGCLFKKRHLVMLKLTIVYYCFDSPVNIYPCSVVMDAPKSAIKSVDNVGQRFLW